MEMLCFLIGHPVLIIFLSKLPIHLCLMIIQPKSILSGVTPSLLTLMVTVCIPTYRLQALAAKVEAMELFSVERLLIRYHSEKVNL